MNTTSNATQMSNREFFRQWEAAALSRIPGIRELMAVHGNQRHTLEQKYPDAAFALDILSNPFVQDRELGSIRMDAYSAILNGELITGVHYKYDRQMDAYVAQHYWDWFWGIDMTQKIKNTLAALHRGQQVTVIYDGKFEHQCLRVTGKVVTVDHFWKTLQVNKVAIDFSEIYEIIR